MTAAQYDNYRRRITQLADELEKLEGFIHMSAWVEIGDGSLEAARANPCGTAACIAGKAGLMEVFREEGFEWHGFRHDRPTNACDFSGFTQAPVDFFGTDVSTAVFTGDWAMTHVHTPQQAAILLRHFLEEWNEETTGDPKWDDDWEPSPAVLDRIIALRPQSKVFPVSGLRWDYEVDDEDWTLEPLDRHEAEA